MDRHPHLAHGRHLGLGARALGAGCQGVRGGLHDGGAGREALGRVDGGPGRAQALGGVDPRPRGDRRRGAMPALQAPPQRGAPLLCQPALGCRLRREGDRASAGEPAVRRAKLLVVVFLQKR